VSKRTISPWLAGSVAVFAALLLVIAGCDDDDSSDESSVGSGTTVRVADKGFAESSIIAQMYAAVLEDQGFSVDSSSLASTEIADAAILGGDIDVYPEYTGTAYLNVLKLDGADAPAEREAQYEQVRDGYAERGLTTLTPSPYNNGNEVACLEETGVTTLEELGEASGDLVYSANAEHLTRDDGLPLLQEEYGVEFKDIKTVDISLRYQPIEDGDAQCVYAFGTDPKLGQLTELVVLEDGKGLFTGGVSFQNFPVINTEWLEGLTEEQQTALTDALDEVDALLTADAIRPLIARVEFDKDEPADVARDFLSEQGAL
jgi:osmoprotectant transport system substrate-binding protein